MYTFLNSSPTSLTEFATPFRSISNENHDFGVFAQDVWRMNRATITGAVRYDWFKTGFPAQTVVAGSPLLGLGNRNISFPESDNINWKDLTYRMGFVYDVRGDGRSAIKIAANKYLLGQTLNGFGVSPNPVNALQVNTTRSWADSNKNFVVDCNLASGAAQNLTASGGDNCGAILNSAFGTTIPGATFDPDLLTGWGHRPSNWEFSAGIQQQLPGRMSLEVSYYRRIWQNFPVVDNVLAGPSDFQQFNMTVPTDARLPNGGGNQLTYYNVNPNKLGQTQNYNTLSDKYGNEYEHWNGVDVSVSGRLTNGLRFQAGTGTGHTVTDNCAVIAQLPEMLTFGVTNAATVATTPAAAGGQLATQFCHLEEPWLTGFKGLVVYTLPKVDVQLAATFRSVPGITNGGNAQPSGVFANFVATNAYLAANSNLGRLLTGTTAATQNTTLQIVNPDTVYLDRDNQLDFRVGKVFRWRGTRSTVNLDLYNALNRSTILTANQAYALTNNVWLAPTSITNPRLAKISLTLDLK
jgi:hypothetical protein